MDEKITVLEKKAAADAERFGMFRKGTHVAAGISGGADSTALLHLLCASKTFAPLELRVTVCHVNHNLRGEESNRDERFVRELCERLGAEFRLLSIDAAALAERLGGSVEEVSRRERYRFFEETAQTLGGDAVIATAHTLDDSLETFFINLARGSGLAGLAGIPPVRGSVVRPLISCTRREVEEYCAANGLNYVTDSTNLSDDYTRNRVRHNIVPALREIFPELDSSFARAAGLLLSDACFISEETEKLLRDARRSEGLDAGTLNGAHPALRGRALLRLLGEAGAQQSEKKVRELERVLSGELNAAEPVRNVYFTLKDGLLLKEEKNEPEPYFEQEFEPLNGEEKRLNSLYRACVRLIDAEGYKNLKKVNSKLYYNCIDYDKISKHIKLRQRLPGDKMTVSGGTKSLKKLLNEKGVPPRLRDRIPCAADESGVFWVFGAGCAKRAMVDENSKNICVFEILEDKNDGNGK